MMKYLKLFHYLGLVLFLGSIFVYILLSTITSHNSLENLVFTRQIIHTGTVFLTIPGLGLVLLSGLVMTGKYYGFGKHRWLNIKQFLFTQDARDGASENGSLINQGFHFHPVFGFSSLIIQ